MPDADTRRSLPWTVAEDHPAFAGHFPGQPLLPGVVLLAAVQEAAAALGPGWTAGALHLASAKFLAPLRPGARCDIRLHLQDGRLRFEIREGEVIAASGVMERAGE